MLAVFASGMEPFEFTSLQKEGNMTHQHLGLSSGVAKIVSRLFSDPTFQNDALANPELAFAHYSLEEEERLAIKSLLGKLGPDGSFSLKAAEPLLFWGA